MQVQILATQQLPTTRYRGSKRRYEAAVKGALQDAQGTTIRDIFGGSGIVSCMADQVGKQAVYTDMQAWSATCVRALLEHEYSRSDLRQVQAIIDSPSQPESGPMAQAYQGIYFLGDENATIDRILQATLDVDPPIRDLVRYGLYQALLAKVPMSLFHRASLSQRTAKVDRRSRNSKIWNEPVEVLAMRFIQEASTFAQFRRLDHEVRHEAIDVTNLDFTADDALFLDPPYINPNGGVPTYSQAYHLLEALETDYWNLGDSMDETRANRPWQGGSESLFETPEGWIGGMTAIVEAAPKSDIIATVRNQDKPGYDDLVNILKDAGRHVKSAPLHSRTIFSNNPRTEYLVIS